MKIGVPKETKADESRVALLPVGVETLVDRGHRVLVQRGAGEGSGFEDSAYIQAGAELLVDVQGLYEQADLVVKVKEPQQHEYDLPREGQLVLTYFHFAADATLTDAMMRSGATCLAYETLRDGTGKLPLLTPMSEVAGRLSIQAGAKCLESAQGGRGVLLAGVPGVAPAHVTVLGGGVVGVNAARMAAGLGAQVTILDVNLDRLRYLDEVMPPNIRVLFSDRSQLSEELRRSDLVIGAVLIPGARAPHLVRRDDLQRMQPGSVLVDVAIDQGGCFESSRPTTHQEPTFVDEDVIHYCVANIPAAVGRTSTLALCHATLPYILRLADGGAAAIRSDPDLASALNIDGGKIVHAAVASAFPHRKAS